MSKEVERYTFVCDIENDEYVLASDYDALLAERDELKKDAERYRRMRAVVIAEREGCTEELYDNQCDRLLEAYDAALQGEQP